MNFAEKLMQRIGAAPETLDVNRVLGDPETRGETTLVPVTEMIVTRGLASGLLSDCCGDNNDECCGEGSANAGVALTRPIATIEVGPQGTIVRPIIDTPRIQAATVLFTGWVVGWLALAVRTLLDRENA